MGPANVAGLNCRACGAPMTVRAGGHARSVVCPSCLVVGDPNDPSVRIVQEAASKQRRTPLIPLGTRGRLDEGEFEVIGYQYRAIGASYGGFGWEEYLLFNPYRGFRYLTQYDGHWNLVRAVNERPDPLRMTWQGRDFRHFQTAHATTDFVLGEFPWRVQMGHDVEASDFIAPPTMLSREVTPEETTWSVGTYVPGDTVWQWFSLEGLPPGAIGVFANQPSPYAGKPWRYWTAFAVFALLVLAVGCERSLTSGAQVLQMVGAMPPLQATPVRVSEPFQLTGRPSNVVVDIDASLTNNWSFFSITLVNEETGVAYEAGREISYYTGVEDGVSWTEGGRTGSVVFPTVESGPHVLRVEQEQGQGAPVGYQVRVRRDVMSWFNAFAALALLAIPPALVTWRSMRFEHERWAEADEAEDTSLGWKADEDD